MSSLSKRAAVVATLIVTAAVSYYAGSSRTGSVTPGAVDTTASSGEAKVLYWRAPMDPNERYDAPGKSRMGMDLIPVYEGDAEASADDENFLKIDPVSLQRINFSSERAEVGRLNPIIRTTGRFSLDETARTSISLKVGGWVERLFVNFDGAMVEPGEPILELYSPDLVATQEEYLVAIANHERLRGTPAEDDAVRLVNASRRRLEYWEMTEDQINRLEETKSIKREITFYAPHAGEVMNINVAAGQHVEPGHRLMDVVDISKIWLIVDVYEEDLSRVSVGSKATVTLGSVPGEQFEGKVDYIYHTMNDQLRTARARIVLPGRYGGPLKPGMYATAYLEAGQTEPEILVSDGAVLRTGARELVIVSLGGGRFRPQEVTTGLSAAGRTQILSGLREGERVVTNAQFLIDSEARLTGVIAAMTSDVGGMEGMGTGEMERMEMEGMEGMDARRMGGMEMEGMEGMDMQGTEGMTEDTAEADPMMDGMEMGQKDQ